jgi:hypothetical protein
MLKLIVDLIGLSLATWPLDITVIATMTDGAVYLFS